jgi:hypothetical protein
MRDHPLNGVEDAPHPAGVQFFVRAVSGGFRAATFFCADSRIS